MIHRLRRRPARRAPACIVSIAAMASMASLASIAAADLNAHIVAHVPYPVACAGVWGYSAPDGTELAIIGMQTGTSFVDVTVPSGAHETAFIPGNNSPWREIRTWSHYAYIVTEGRPAVENGPSGVQIVDLADPAHPQLVGSYNETFTTAHSLGIYDGYLYINGSKLNGGSAGMRILSLADPLHPHDVGSYATRYVHDGYVRGDIGYLCNIGLGLVVADLRNKARPMERRFLQYPGAFTHNAWTSRDGTVLYTTDETIGGHLRVWDVFDPADPVQIGEWSAHPEASIHNVVVQGDSAYVSYYTEGVVVLDLARLDQPRVVASVDTYPGLSGGYFGCWGVYPCARTGRVYASDIQSGLFVIQLEAPPLTPVTLQSFDAVDVEDGVALRWSLQRDAADAGSLAVERCVTRAGTAPGAYAPAARFALGDGAWTDRTPAPGDVASYRLVLETAAGAQVLGERRVHRAAVARSRLLGAVPNPFNPATRIRFELARAGDVWLDVFDARGRRIRRLQMPGAAAGAHAFDWDGRDARGAALPSGTYVFTVQSRAWRARGRAILTK